MGTTDREATFTEIGRRRQILDAAIASVNELGYHRTSLATVAAQAGVAKSAVIYYLESKESLLMQVVDHAFAPLGASLMDAVAAQSTPTEKLRAYAEAYLRFVDRNRAPVAAAVAILVSHRGDDGKPLYLVEDAAESELLRQILAAGIDTGEFRRMPIADAIRIVETLLDLPITLVQRDLNADFGHLSTEIMAFLLTGIAPAHTAPERAD